MHQTQIRREILDRVLARRGRVHWFDTLEAARTAVLVIDMQETFCAPGGPAEVPSARGIIGSINTLTAGLRMRGVPVIWVLHANARRGSATDWDLFFNYVVADDVRERTIESLAPGRQRVWGDLVTAPQDLTITKNRYSALIAGSSGLERELRERGIDTVLIAGTKTNVCCEATARDAMMLDFKVVMVSDCCAALSDHEHQASLETIIQQFGDVLTTEEIFARLDCGSSLQVLDSRPAPVRLAKSVIGDSR
ncbi:MAG: cysteine hydrolase [Xanthobacteraceae bacterium]|nr:cysteine hydrolase [Xanthobacteraceae bacterium]MBV9628594.1 cysteine hydrolase [Xanthobacteraceae bacterium]